MEQTIAEIRREWNADPDRERNEAVGSNEYFEMLGDMLGMFFEKDKHIEKLVEKYYNYSLFMRTVGR